MVPDLARSTVERFLHDLDEAVPGWVVEAHLGGSVALGAFRAGRSDLDVFAVVTHAPDEDELARIRRAQARHYRRSLPAILRGGYPLVCNTTYLREGDLHRPPSDVVPVLSHNSWKLHVGEGHDVNPVAWWVLAHGAETVRGPALDRDRIPQDAAERQRWNRENLDTYWAGWARAMRRPTAARTKAQAFRLYAVPWGVLGSPRLLRTITEGDVVSKEDAGLWAMDVLDRRWRPLVERTVAWWRSGSTPMGLTSARGLAEAADLVDEVIARARAVP